MHTKTALIIALSLAIGLPYLTVVVLQGGAVGRVAIGLLFVGALLLIVGSDLRASDG